MQYIYNLIIICIGGISAASGQHWLNVYSVKNGLSQNTVTCLYRDSKNIMWVGTQDGLNRFDGYHFTHFKYNERDTTSISDQYVTAIEEDGAGNLWVGTRNGLNLFNREKQVFTRYYPDLRSKKVVQYAFERMHRTPSGDLLFVAAGKVFRWYTASRKLLPVLQLNKFIMDISLLRDTLWIFTADSGFMKWPAARTGILSAATPLTNDLPHRQYVQNNRYIWLVKDYLKEKSIIRIWDTRSQRWLPAFPNLNTTIHHISFDRQSGAWIATDKGIFLADQQGNLRPFLFSNFPSSASVLCTYPDGEGYTWIGFASGGMAVYNPLSAAFRAHTTGIANEVVYCSAELGSDRMLLGASSGLYLRHTATGATTKIFSEKVLSLAVEPSGTIWAGTDNMGIYLLNAKGRILGRHAVANGRLQGDKVFHLQYQPGFNRMLISTIRGFCVYDMGTGVTHFFTHDAVSPDWRICGSYVIQSFTDSRQQIWISNNEGIDVLDARLQHVRSMPTGSDTASFIRRSIVTGTAEDPSGSMWISTLSNGIYRLDSGSFRQFTTLNGLSSNVIYGLASDAYGRIWAATSSGMNLLDAATGRIIALSNEDGMPATDFFLSTLRKNAEGHIWVGSPDGLIEIVPEKFRFPDKTYRVSLTRAMVNYDTVAVKHHYELSESDKIISFEFSAPAYVNASRLLYEYRLRGFSDDWQPASADNRRISFTNLPYDSFRLEIRSARLAADLAQAPVTSVSLVRHPPFYRTGLFMFIAFLTISALAWLAIRLVIAARLQKGLRKAEMDQNILMERERISRDLHDHLGAYTAAIKTNISQLELQYGNASGPVTQLRENADEMMISLRETIWALQHSKISITDFSDRFKVFMQKLSGNYGGVSMQLKESIQGTASLAPGESIQLFRMMQEALNNAIRHAGATAITVHLTAGPNGLDITVSDNGKGFDTAGTYAGYGLTNMKQRALDGGFRLEVTSGSGGTEVRISRPATTIAG